jgi:acyl-CoA synthetase (AMP-forming)/AMP-acid ligase II
LVGSGGASAESWEQALAGVAEAGNGDCPVPLAAIMYTSGTTGAPKGVALGHGNFAANTDAILDYLQLGPADRMVSVLPFHYAYGASLLHTHIAAVASLVLEPNLVFPHAVVDTIERSCATGFSGVPSTFALLLDRGVLQGRRLDSLRYVTQAGGAMSPAQAERLRRALPSARLFVMYGQTEATARLTYLPPEHLDARPGSVGRALRGVEIEIRGEEGRVLAPGHDGEVWVRGGNVMAGYWNDPVATAAVLRDGWLRTGDVGRVDADGYLYLAGRRSDIIKTGAHRVHPLEIEEALLELPWVAEVAVTGVDDPVLGQVIKAHVVASGAGDANAVRAHCRARLAPHKVPRLVEFVPSLPKTLSGKIHRAALMRTPAEAVEIL